MTDNKNEERKQVGSGECGSRKFNYLTSQLIYEVFMNNDSKVWLNGNLIPWQEATVPILSHGFSRGSAIFDVFGVHVGPTGPVAFRMDEHLNRLMNSAALLEMQMAYSTQEIIEAVKSTVDINQLESWTR